MAALGIAAITTLGGTVTGMIVGDSLGAIPAKVAVPAASNNAKAKVVGGGKPVSGQTTARQSLWHSAFLVIAAIAVLILGSRFLKDARIG